MRYCITFAGPAGSAKSPIATYLSWKLGLPVFSTDVIRTEVKEDTGKTDINDSLDVYNERRNARFDEVVDMGTSFIYDASLDRTWDQVFGKLEAAGYRVIIISIDLSDDFYKKLLRVKDYLISLELSDGYIADHQKFLDGFKGEVALRITDANFKDRLELSLQAVRACLSK